MPVHDWSKVDSGAFHDFHQGWMIGIRNKLNRALLPDGYFAMVEPSWPKLDVRTEDELYASKAARVAVFSVEFDQRVASVEVMSRGDKSTESAVTRTVVRLMEEWERGSNVLVVDLQQPTDGASFRVSTLLGKKWTGNSRRPIEDEKPFEIVRLRVGFKNGAVKPVSLGSQKIGMHSQLPDVAVYLAPARESGSGSMIDEINAIRYGINVTLSLEGTYMDAWNDLPRRWREVIDSTD